MRPGIGGQAAASTGCSCSAPTTGTGRVHPCTKGNSRAGQRGRLVCGGEPRYRPGMSRPNCGDPVAPIIPGELSLNSACQIACSFLRVEFPGRSWGPRPKR